MATAAKAKQNTVSLKHLAAALAENHEMPKKQSEAMLNELVAFLESLTGEKVPAEIAADITPQ